MARLVHPDNPTHEVEATPDQRPMYESAGWVLASSKEAKTAPKK